MISLHSYLAINQGNRKEAYGLCLELLVKLQLHRKWTIASNQIRCYMYRIPVSCCVLLWPIVVILLLCLLGVKAHTGYTRKQYT